MMDIFIKRSRWCETTVDGLQQKATSQVQYYLIIKVEGLFRSSENVWIEQQNQNMEHFDFNCNGLVLKTARQNEKPQPNS